MAAAIPTATSARMMRDIDAPLKKACSLLDRSNRTTVGLLLIRKCCATPAEIAQPTHLSDTCRSTLFEAHRAWRPHLATDSSHRSQRDRRRVRRLPSASPRRPHPTSPAPPERRQPVTRLHHL